MPVTHGVASSSLVQTAKRVDELISSALFCKIEYLDSLDRINTKRQYQYLQNRFLPLLPDNVSWKELTYEDLQTAVFNLRKQGLKDSSISVMVRALKSLWNNQYKKGLAPAPPRFDFKLKTGAIPEYLSREDLLKLIEIKGQYEAIDVWLLLYFFRGMNFKDLALLKSHQIVDGRVYYYRSKTGKEVPNFKVHKVAREILGIYDCKENSYVMPYIYDSVHRTDRSKDYRVKKVRKKLIRELRQVFKSLSIKDPLRPFYCARYTFALHLSEHPNQDLFQIKRALGHQSIVTTEKYIQRLNLFDLDRYIDESIPL